MDQKAEIGYGGREKQSYRAEVKRIRRVEKEKRKRTVCEDFINMDRRKKRKEKVVVCVHEKGDVGGNGGRGIQRRGKISYLVGVRTAKRYTVKRKGKQRTWGKGREKESG